MLPLVALLGGAMKEESVPPLLLSGSPELLLPGGTDELLGAAEDGGPLTVPELGTTTTEEELSGARLDAVGREVLLDTIAALDARVPVDVDGAETMPDPVLEGSSEDERKDAPDELATTSCPPSPTVEGSPIPASSSSEDSLSPQLLHPVMQAKANTAPRNQV